MFTGIIQKKANIKKLQTKNNILYTIFELPKSFKLKKGASISINGICSTVISFNTKEFAVGYMKETLDKTTVKNWKSGMTINLESSLKLGDTLDGHFVYGHIDTVGTIKSINKVGDSHVFEIIIPKEFSKYVVYKGSIAIDGVSLTVSSKLKNTFTVSLIPHTLSVTNLSGRRVGDSVNVEFDALSKYIFNK